MALIGGSRGLVLGVGSGLLVLLCLLAGCGSSGDSPPEALKPVAFRSQANAVCRTATQAREKATKKAVSANQGKGGDEAQELMGVLVSPIKRMAVELGELGTPKGDTKRIKAILSAYEAGVTKLEADPTSPKAAFAFSKADKLANQYGLTDCAI